MKKLPFLVAGWVCLLLPMSAQEYVLDYVSRSGSGGWDRLSAMATDQTGNLFTVSYTECIYSQKPASGVESFPHQASLQCRDQENRPLWILNFSSSSFFIINPLTVSLSGNLILAGTFYDTLWCETGFLAPVSKMNMFIASVDTAGSLYRHSILFPGTGGFLQDILCLPGGQTVICGYFEGRMSNGTNTYSSRGRKDVFLALMDQDGDIHWIRQLGGKGDDVPVAIEWLGNRIWLGGNFTRDLHLRDTVLYSAGKEDIFLACFDTAGTFIQAFTEGGKGSELMTGMTGNNHDLLWYTGSYEGVHPHGSVSAGGKDMFLAARDGAGNLRHFSTGGGISDDTGLRLLFKPPDILYVTGSFKHLFSYRGYQHRARGKNTDIFLMKVAENDSVYWMKRLGGAYEETAGELAADAYGNLYVGGNFLVSSDFDREGLVSEGGKDIYLAKFYDPCSRLSLNLGPDRVLCPGAVDTLRAGSSFETLIWNGISGTDQELLVSNPGMYTLTAIDPHGCRLYDTVQIHEDLLEVSAETEDELIPPGNNGSVWLSVSGNNGPFSYLWSTGDTSASLHQLSAGFYSAEISDRAGCTASLNIELGSQVVIGIGLNVEPNPMVQVSTVTYTIPARGRVELALFDQSGRKLRILFEGSLDPGTYGHDLNREGLPGGLYVVQLRTEKDLLTRKVLISGQ